MIFVLSISLLLRKVSSGKLRLVSLLAMAVLPEEKCVDQPHWPTTILFDFRVAVGPST